MKVAEALKATDDIMEIITELKFLEILKCWEFSKHQAKGWSGRSKGGMESNKERHSHKKCEKEKEKKIIKGAVGKELGEIGNWVCMLLRFLWIFHPVWLCPRGDRNQVELKLGTLAL